MNNKTTELVFILDKSGSMSGLEKDTIGGFNAMIERQKEQDGKVFVSTLLFSNDTEVLHDRQTLEEIKPLTEDDYIVGGGTALLDAIGGAIKHIRNVHKYARKEDVPEKTLFVITTDGMENASRKYTAKQVKDMIHRQEESNWEFLFLASNIDAVETAESVGIRRDRAVNYDAQQTTTEMYSAVGQRLCMFRCDAPFSANFALDIEQEIKEKKKAHNKLSK